MNLALWIVAAVPAVAFLAAGIIKRRHEAVVVAVNLVCLAVAAVVAWGRFGPGPFTG